MLIVRSVQRADLGYYLNGPAEGRWTGTGCADLGLEGPVEASALRHVLAARHPHSGQHLLDRAGPRRRDAWGLVFAAPKSLSLVQALSPVELRAAVDDAHRRAVASALSHLERYGMWSGRGGRDRQLVEVTGMIGAAFDHHHNDLGEPHLHTHVLVANLVQADDRRWSAFRSGPWWAERQAASALYQLGLRYELAQLGLRFAWERHPNGLTDVVGVPRSSIEAASRRSFFLQLDARRWNGERAAPSRRSRAVAQGRTRQSVTVPARDRSETTTWQQRVAQTGFDPPRTSRLVEQARSRRRPALVEPTTQQVTRRLLEAGATFRRADVVRAIAELSDDGLPHQLVQAGADRFCDQAQQVVPGRWTTAESVRLEAELADRVTSQRARGRGRVAPSLATAVLAEVSGDESQQAAEGAWRLVTAGHGIELLASHTGGGDHPPPVTTRGDRSCLLAQAEVIDLARRVWQAAGHRVVVLSDAANSRRWEALAGVDTGPAASEMASVLIVDRADRIAPGKLLTLLDQADRQGAKVVLIAGGSAPTRRWAATMTLQRWPPELGVVPIGSNQLSVAPGVPCLTTTLSPAGAPRADVPAAGVSDLSVAGTGRHAMSALLSAWGRASPGTTLPPVMVGLGAAEVNALNQAGRDCWRDAGRLQGPTLQRRGRELQAGDVVMALRYLGPLAPGSDSRSHRGSASAAGIEVPAGTRGRVTSVDPGRGVLQVTWWPAPGRAASEPRPFTTRLSGGQLDRVAHGYATTPSYLGASNEPVFVLGSPSALGARRNHVQGAWLIAPTFPRTGPEGGDGRLGRLAETLPEAPRAPATPPEQATSADHTSKATPPEPATSAGRTSEATTTASLANSSLAELAARRSTLVARLRSTDAGRSPPGVRALSDYDSPSTQPDPSRATTGGLTAAEERWVAEHAEALIAWRDLGRAEALRRDLLGWRKELQAINGLEPELGRLPELPAARAAWRRATRQLAAFEDRWPAEPGTGPTTAAERSLSTQYQADLVRAERARAQLAREQLREHSQALGLG